MKRLSDIEERIADAITSECELGCADNEPYCTDEIEVNGLLVTISGHYWADGYCENDYYNGTGAWVAIDEIEAYEDTEDGNEVSLDIDENLIELYVEKELTF